MQIQIQEQVKIFPDKTRIFFKKYVFKNIKNIVRYQICVNIFKLYRMYSSKKQMQCKL